MVEILSAHVTHHWVDLADLELFTSKEALSLLESVKTLPAVDEAVVLKTCNRVEVYAATREPAVARQSLEGLAGGSLPGELRDAVRFLGGRESVHHLLRVASGLDSLIVGEDQVLGQVRDAYEFALKHGAVGKTLDLVFRKALSVGKKVRAETGIGKGAVSIGSAAVKLAEKLLGNLEGKTVLVLGAGEIAALVAKAMAGKHLRAIFVANRTRWRAAELARSLGGIAIGYEQLPDYLPLSDVIITATGAPHVVLSRPELERCLGLNPRREKLLIIDLSNPRNVAEEVNLIPNVELRNLDGLREIARENFEQRRREATRAEALVSRELTLLLRRLQEGRAQDLAARFHRQLGDVRDEELRELLRRLPELGEKERRVVAEFANALINRVGATPTRALKDAARSGDMETLQVAARLLGLGDE
jgi:glutamyl-tRNA reductase